MAETVPGLVSTIIPVYNRPTMIYTAVESVLAQTYRPIEIILVNDGSTDNTGEVLDSIALAHPGEVVVVHQRNGGAGLAREAGRAIARGEYIQYLDSDDWLLSNKFTDQVIALRENPDCGIAYGVTRLVNEQGDVVSEPSKWTGQKHDYLFPGLLVDRWWHTHTPLYGRPISDLAGAWPKQRPEDWDLEARMGAHRVKLVHCGTVVSCHLDHEGEGRVSRGNHEAYLRDEAWFLPRLYTCAVQAGVLQESPEMNHFSRWAFMRARHLGAIGETASAANLYRVAVLASHGFSPTLTGAGLLASLVGWKAVGKLSTLRENVPF